MEGETEAEATADEAQMETPREGAAALARQIVNEVENLLWEWTRESLETGTQRFAMEGMAIAAAARPASQGGRCTSQTVRSRW